MAIFRRDNYLVVSRATATLPQFCVKCGEPATKVLRKTFFWHNPAYYLTIFLCSPLIYVLVTSFVSKKMPMGYFLCKAHAARRRNLLIAATLLLLGSIPLGVAFREGLGIPIASVGFLAGLVVMVLATNTLRPVKMTDTEATYTGVGELFLRKFSAN
jgi:hypothetical protein